MPTGLLTVERYVQLLYPRLAWDATLRLGDPSTAGRLVERVLHRAWRERERFAVGDALLRHATESAEAAVAREEGRRRSVTQFDADEAGSGLPGDLSPLSTHAVADRLRTGRAPMPTPPTGASTISPGREPLAADLGQPVTVATPAPDRSQAPPEPATSHESAGVLDGAALHAPRPSGRASWATPRGDGNHTAESTATSNTATHRTSGQHWATGQHQASGQHQATGQHQARPTLRSASYIAKETRRPAPRMLAMGLGALAVAAAGLWRITAGPSDAEAARIAAADSTASLMSTGRGEQRDTTLAPGFVASMGPSSSVSTPAALRDGVRGVSVSGVVSLDLTVDSARPAAVLARGQLFELPGGRLNVVTAGDTVLLFPETGDVIHRGATTTRIASGQSVRVLPAGAVEGLEPTIAARRFAWRTGRLVTERLPARDLRDAVGTWFGVDLITDVTDSLSLDVPLGSVDSLVVAFERPAGLQATLASKAITVAHPAPVVARVRRAPPAPATEVELPVLRRLPGVPDIPPS